MTEEITFAKYNDHGIAMLRKGLKDGTFQALYTLEEQLEHTLIALRRLEKHDLQTDLIPGIKYAMDLITEQRRKAIETHK